MPPKLSPVRIDEKLENLHESVRDHVGLLAGRNGTSLRTCLRKTASAEETRWHGFLYKQAAAFSKSQRRHVHETFAMLAEQTKRKQQKTAGGDLKRFMARKTSEPAPEPAERAREQCQRIEDIVTIEDA